MLQRRQGRICVVCGSAIAMTMSSKAICCSRECSVKYQNGKKQAARDAAKATRGPCVYCGGVIPPERRNNVLYCSSNCKHNAISARQRVRAPHYMREYLYGITAEQYEGMLKAQDYRCAICRSDEWRGKNNSPHVDHCHTSGEVRGILCGNCNHGLGKFEDDPVRLRAAAAYLEKYPS
jgi:predicted nucleic acid-binding Zn ribbon protein